MADQDYDQQAYSEMCRKFLSAAKNSPYAADIYHALQAALAYHATLIMDVSEIADELMPSIGRHPRAGISMGSRDFDLLRIVFDITRAPTVTISDLKMTDSGDSKWFHFTRKVRCGEVFACIKVDNSVS